MIIYFKYNFSLQNWTFSYFVNFLSDFKSTSLFIEFYRKTFSPAGCILSNEVYWTLTWSSPCSTNSWCSSNTRPSFWSKWRRHPTLTSTRSPSVCSEKLSRKCSPRWENIACFIYPWKIFFTNFIFADLNQGFLNWGSRTIFKRPMKGQWKSIALCPINSVLKIYSRTKPKWKFYKYLKKFRGQC